MWRFSESYEKLLFVRVFPTVGHAADPSCAVSERGVELIPELTAISLDIRRSTSTSVSRVSSLSHKTTDHSVELRVVIFPMFTKLDKIFCRFWDQISFNFDADGPTSCNQDDSTFELL
jgi:hypothetical protein